MLDELERRNYSASTVRAYIRTVENFAQYFKSRPDRLGPEQIRQYQAHLFRDRKLAPNTVAQRVAALRFFYIRTGGLGTSAVGITPQSRRILFLDPGGHEELDQPQNPFTSNPNPPHRTNQNLSPTTPNPPSAPQIRASQIRHFRPTYP